MDQAKTLHETKGEEKLRNLSSAQVVRASVDWIASESARLWKVGDRCVLNSGGPCMTIIDVGRDTGSIWCSWMSDGELRQDIFPPQTIRPAT